MSLLEGNHGDGGSAHVPQAFGLKPTNAEGLKLVGPTSGSSGVGNFSDRVTELSRPASSPESFKPQYQEPWQDALKPFLALHFKLLTGSRNDSLMLVTGIGVPFSLHVPPHRDVPRSAAARPRWHLLGLSTKHYL